MPQSQESVEIVKRFFYTLEQLKEMKVIRGGKRLLESTI